MSEPVIVSAVDFADAVDSYTGWCTACQEFTREATEPDAEEYDCPVCEDYTVMGAEQALMLGIIEVES